MTKRQIEARVSEAIIKFEKDYMGRGPTETRTSIIKDMVLEDPIILLTMRIK